MLAAAALALLLQTPPTAAPQPVATPAAALPADPKMIAWSQFVAFATDTVNPSFFTDPPPPAQIQAAKSLLLSAGRIKHIVLVRRADARFGLGFVYRLECEHGIAYERFTLKDGKITSIAFSKK